RRAARANGGPARRAGRPEPPMPLVRNGGPSAPLVVALLAAAGVACGAAPDGSPLFRDAAREPAAPPADSPRVLRSRYVEVDFDALGGASAGPASMPATLLLNLFPDATFVAERDHAEPTSSGRGAVWAGHLQGAPGSS